MEMEQDLRMARAQEDRRRMLCVAPPYMTEEGIVLIDRREGADRRRPLAAAPSASRPDMAVEHALVLERLKLLAEVYGYCPAEIKAGSSQ